MYGLSHFSSVSVGLFILAVMFIICTLGLTLGVIDPTRTKTGKAKNLFDSLTIKQALHKNHALNAHLSLCERIVEQERHRISAEIDKQRKKIQNTINEIRKTNTLRTEDLYERHENKRDNVKEVAIHMVNCYMRRQDKRKSEYLMLQEQGLLPDRRPVVTPDHLCFIREIFPETFSYSVDQMWQYKYDPKMDVYAYGRAGHDIACSSMRNKPVGAILGAYTPQFPVNVRFWRPSPTGSDGSDHTDMNKDTEPRRRGAMRQKKLNLGPKHSPSSYLTLPQLGLVEVKKDGVFSVERTPGRSVRSTNES